jgi:hypothetical protein
MVTEVGFILLWNLVLRQHPAYSRAEQRSSKRWRCSQCEHNNPGYLDNCESCGAGRPN